MTTRTFLGLALSTSLCLCLVACLGKTTSLGGTTDATDGSDHDGGPASSSGGSSSGSSGGSSSGSSGAVDSGPASSNLACQIGSPMLPTAPCPSGEYCKSDDGTCGGAARCVKRPPTPPPFCPDLECGCDGNVRCRDTSRAVAGVDVGPSGTCSLPCGTKSCDGVTEYCLRGSGGMMTPDGGVTTFHQCSPIPTACRIDHSCTCLLANSGTFGICTETGGKLDLDAPLP